jgi:hypothetical protein
VAQDSLHAPHAVLLCSPTAESLTDLNEPHRSIPCKEGRHKECDGIAYWKEWLDLQHDCTCNCHRPRPCPDSMKTPIMEPEGGMNKWRTHTRNEHQVGMEPTQDVVYAMIRARDEGLRCVSCCSAYPGAQDGAMSSSRSRVICVARSFSRAIYTPCQQGSRPTAHVALPSVFVVFRRMIDPLVSKELLG